jgi:Metallo-peptidase family M12B Reprolysin-like
MKKLSIILKRGGVALLLFFTSNLLFAQTEFMTVFNDTEASNLAQTAYQRWQNMKSPSYSTEAKLISIPDVRTAQVEGLLTFKLPGTSDTIIAEADMVTDDPVDGFCWTGQIIEGGFGYIMLGIKSDMKFGIIQHNAVHYEIIPLSPTRQAFVKPNAITEPLECPLGSTPANITFGDEDQCVHTDENNQCQAVINLLAVVMPSAVTELNGIWGDYTLPVRLSTWQTNYAFVNSNIRNKVLKVKAVTAPAAFTLGATTNYSVDLINFTAYVDTTLRPQYGADLAMLITNKDYGLVGGYAWWSLDPNPDAAHSLIVSKYLTRLGVFEHEIGHNLGCRHDWANDNPIVYICAHGHRHIEYTSLPINSPPLIIEGSGFSWRTIMTVMITSENGVQPFSIQDEATGLAINMSDYGMIPYYSNPYIQYGGDTVGDSTGYITDNAEEIRNTGCAVADYNTTQELALFIDHEKGSCEKQIFKAIVNTPAPGQLGQPPYTFYWYANYSGIFTAANPGYYLGTGQTLQLDAHFDCPSYWIICVLNAPDGTYMYQSQKITVDPACGPCIRSAEYVEEKKPSLGYTIAPNPVFSEFLQIIPEGDTYNSTYQIHDMYGRLLVTGLIPEGWSAPFDIRLPQLSAGVYSLTIIPTTGQQASVTKSFIKH